MESTVVFVDGKWTAPLSFERCDVINPSTGERMGTVPLVGAEDIDRAISAAKRAFSSSAWSSLSASERAKLLGRLADEIEAMAPAFADIISREAGIPAAYAIDLHVLLPLQFVRYYADYLNSYDPETRFVSNGGQSAHAIRRTIPAGVAALIVPWNIPITGILAKASPALAAGCTVVIKPSPETPLSANLFAQAVERAGFPAGVVNVVLTDAAGSKQLCTHPDVAHVSFTGSSSVGREIAIACAASFKRSTLELGGNAAAIILDDAPIDTFVADLAMQSLILNNGEACVMQRRVLVPRHQMRAWAEALGAAVSALTVGDASDPATMVGPMISARHQERVRGHVGQAIRDGAVLATELGPDDEFERGFFVRPTVFTNCRNDMKIAREEVFGPVACLIPYDSEEEAIQMANDTEYGLSGSVWSADVDRAERVGRCVRAGTVWTNNTLRLDPQVPFGGMKESGWGRELGPDGILEFCETQTLFRPL